jgi:hypothetical protein
MGSDATHGSPMLKAYFEGAVSVKDNKPLLGM